MHPVFVILFVHFFLFFNAAAQKTKEISPIKTFCEGPEFVSDKIHFRGNGFAESTDPTIARDKALMIAKEFLAASIKSQIISITTLYTSSSNQSSAYKQEFESINSESVNETLEGVNIICQKQEKLKNNKIKVYIACEIGVMPVISKMEEKIKDNKVLKVDFDKDKFEQIFNSEMQKTEKPK